MLIAALLMLSGAMSAKVVLPPMFSDNMVLLTTSGCSHLGNSQADENGENYNFLGWKDV